jgi:hypothetical protein
VQVVGGGIEAQLKKAVKITGTPATGATPGAGASQVLNVSNLQALGTCKAVFGSSAAAPAAGGSGEGSGKVAVVAGVLIIAAIGATAGVLATQSNGTTVTLSGTAQ